MSDSIIDFHQHAPQKGQVDARIRACEQASIVKAVLLGLPAANCPGDNDLVLEATRVAPGLFIPFYGVSMDQDTPDAIDRAIDLGFQGLKCIAPLRAYNDPVYFPLYERAAERGLPVLFHLGIVANHAAWRRCDSNLMRAIHLDHIARSIPELRLIGAHFGNPWSDEAAMACRWNSNLYFDLSGSLLKYRPPQFFKELLWWRKDGPYASPDRREAWSKIVFGSDVADEQIAGVVNDYAQLMASLQLDDSLRNQVWRNTAETLLNRAIRIDRD
jgi:predicted TIM-barrel fold metal-dependent hydrolase